MQCMQFRYNSAMASHMGPILAPTQTYKKKLNPNHTLLFQTVVLKTELVSGLGKTLSKYQHFHHSPYLVHYESQHYITGMPFRYNIAITS